MPKPEDGFYLERDQFMHNWDPGSASLLARMMRYARSEKCRVFFILSQVSIR